MTGHDDRDNRADQLNPNNDAYWESRGEDGRPEDWEGPSASTSGLDDDFYDDSEGSTRDPVRSRGRTRPITSFELLRIPFRCPSHGQVKGLLSGPWNTPAGDLEFVVQCPDCGYLQRVEIDNIALRPQPADQLLYWAQPKSLSRNLAARDCAKPCL